MLSCHLIPFTWLNMLHLYIIHSSAECHWWRMWKSSQATIPSGWSVERWGEDSCRYYDQFPHCQHEYREYSVEVWGNRCTGKSEMFLAYPWENLRWWWRSENCTNNINFVSVCGVFHLCDSCMGHSLLTILLIHLFQICVTLIEFALGFRFTSTESSDCLTE